MKLTIFAIAWIAVSFILGVVIGHCIGNSERKRLDAYLKTSPYEDELTRAKKDVI